MSEYEQGKHPRSLENLISIEKGTNLNPLNIGKNRTVGRRIFEKIGDIEIPTTNKAFKELTKRHPELFPRGVHTKFTLRHLLVMRLYWEALFGGNTVAATKEILDREMGKSMQPIEGRIEISPLEKLSEDELIQQLKDSREFTESLGFEELTGPETPGPA